MNKIFKIILCKLILVAVCYATPPSCLELHQSQLNSLNERMNQMLGALYSSPILSKLQSVAKTQPNPSNTTPAAETPETIYDKATSPPNTSPAPQVVYVTNKYPTPSQPSILSSAPPTPVSGSTRTPRSYYSQLDAPLEYSYVISPWSQYYDPYSAISLSYPPTIIPNSLTPVPSYDPYREPEYFPVPYSHHHPYTPQPTYPTPPTYQTVPPSYQTPPPTFHTPAPAYQTPPPTYQTPPPTYQTPSPTYQTPPPTYQTPPPTYHTPPPTYHTPPPTYHTPPTTYINPPATYHTPPPTYHTPPPIYSPSPNIPYSPVHYSRVPEYSPYFI